MGLFRRKPEFDEELESRVDRLQSECRQAKLHCESLPDGPDKQNRLKNLEVAEQAVAEARAEGDKVARTRAMLRAEADLCLTKPAESLVPTANRLRDKFFRLSPEQREAWEKDLDRLMRDGDVEEEQTLRLRLQMLTYELTEAADRYKRLASERLMAIRSVLCASFAILTVLLIALAWYLNGLVLDLGDAMDNAQDGAGAVALSWVRPIPVLLLAGGLGAMISIVPATISGQEKMRPEYAWAHIRYMGVRAVLGSVYAVIVYSATLAHVLPLAVPAEPETAIPFLTVLGFASGYSDRLFGQVLSNLITGKGSSEKKENADS